MKQSALYSTILFLLLFISCRKSNSRIINDEGQNQQPQKMQHVIASGNKLIKEDGKSFRVWGFNWGNGMLEDHWNNDWSGLVGDFKEMSEYGANTVRLPLQYEAFMKNATTPNQQSLNKLKQLIKVAEDNKLYLIVSGLNAFEKQSQPAWYNNMTDDERWATQAVFWEAIAGAIGKSPAVLAYDLMNEPVVAVDPANGWLPGAAFGGYYFVQNIALNTNGRTTVELMRQWIQKMTQAIRKKDSKHLITVGFLPFHTFAQFAPDLGMMSTHLYPKTGETDKDALSIQKFLSDKPLIISEIFPLNCSDVELQQFIVEQNKNVSGWVSHYNGKTLEELQASGTIPDAIYRAALLKFIEMAPTQK